MFWQFVVNNIPQIAQMDTKTWWYFGRCIAGFKSCLFFVGLEALHFTGIIGIFTSKLNMVALFPKFLKHQLYTPENWHGTPNKWRFGRWLFVFYQVIFRFHVFFGEYQSKEHWQHFHINLGLEDRLVSWLTKGNSLCRMYGGWQKNEWRIFEKSWNIRTLVRKINKDRIVHGEFLKIQSTIVNQKFGICLRFDILTHTRPEFSIHFSKLTWLHLAKSPYSN